MNNRLRLGIELIGMIALIGAGVLYFQQSGDLDDITATLDSAEFQETRAMRNAGSTATHAAQNLGRIEATATQAAADAAETLVVGQNAASTAQMRAEATAVRFSTDVALAETRRENANRAANAAIEQQAQAATAEAEARATADDSLTQVAWAHTAQAEAETRLQAAQHEQGTQVALAEAAHAEVVTTATAAASPLAAGGTAYVEVASTATAFAQTVYDAAASREALGDPERFQTEIAVQNTEIARLQATIETQPDEAPVLFAVERLATSDLRIALPAYYVIFRLDRQERSEITDTLRLLGPEFEELALAITSDESGLIRYLGVNPQVRADGTVEFFFITSAPLEGGLTLADIERASAGISSEQAIATLGEREVLRSLLSNGTGVSYQFIAGETIWGITFVTDADSLESRISLFDASVATIRLPD